MSSTPAPGFFSELLPGENPATLDADEAEHWLHVYGELKVVYRRLPPVLERITARERFWSGRAAELRRTVSENARERRDLAARLAREYLAGQLKVHPRELAHLDREEAIELATRIGESGAAG